MLSDADWSAYNTLQSLGASGKLPNGITMDPNALHFLYSDDELRAYDKTDKSDTRPSCQIA